MLGLSMRLVVVLALLSLASAGCGKKSPSPSRSYADALQVLVNEQAVLARICDHRTRLKQAHKAILWGAEPAAKFAGLDTIKLYCPRGVALPPEKDGKPDAAAKFAAVIDYLDAEHEKQFDRVEAAQADRDWWAAREKR